MTENTTTKNFYFPDIEPFLCPDSPISLENDIDNYRNALIETGNSYNIEYANKLLEYVEAVPVKKDFDQYFLHMKKWKKESGYTFNIDYARRKKSFIKYNEKIRLFILKALSSKTFEDRTKYSLDRICDIYGMRLILCFGNSDTLEAIDMCYEVLNETINFFTKKKGYSLKLAEPLLNVDFSQEEHPNIVIPIQSKTCKDYEINIKDYYLNPKKNGYQSLHIVFKSPKGIPIEIQIRTLATHMRVEFDPSCNHDSHDKNKYPERINLNLEKVNLNGFGYYGPGMYHDSIGLVNSIDPFRHF